MDIPLTPDPFPTGAPIRVFQVPYATKVWGFARETGHKLVSELTRDVGSVLIAVHGVGTDSVIEARVARHLAARCGLRAYMAFENRSSRWRGLRYLVPFHDSPLGLHARRGAYEAGILLSAVAEVCLRTGAAPVLVAHSRGAYVLTRAAILREGLAAVAFMEDADGFERVWERVPGFMDVWRRLDEGSKRTLLASRSAIHASDIVSVTACPAVPRQDPSWSYLARWSKNRIWNLYTRRDWFLFFVGNPDRGFIPFLGDRNVRLEFRHWEVSAHPLVQRVVASLLRHGHLTKDVVEKLVDHYLGAPKMAAEMEVVSEADPHL